MSKTSLKFFFMACYDMDRFREFVKSEGFGTTYDVDQETMGRLLSDDLALLEFGAYMRNQTYQVAGDDTLNPRSHVPVGLFAVPVGEPGSSSPRRATTSDKIAKSNTPPALNSATLVV